MEGVDRFDIGEHLGDNLCWKDVVVLILNHHPEMEYLKLEKTSNWPVDLINPLFSITTQKWNT